ncbi:sigma-70 family RNA polymerase sigma factor [Gimesia panareensis]|uniref:ECF RNA polymerase sigma factor SigW n=1 Tax=Gimesia panareensis TaxID=2527978 RepID=A0A518A3K2_9PLAN|nr:sigma-70 family RNA polymerase sigma factor [Gimesia panareensis]QDT26307.1 ECF RNA polymerase sigma factor SigW [Gimesia panareensis]QDU49221.1 ECF RNA polymerase sigma factor SigW [Gimesia panareensis]QDV17543.1 ECF RNA polymerase sigma factor SigW [Gimesia panareensis]
MLEEQEDPQEFLNRLQENPEGVLAEEYNRYRDRLWRIVNFRLDQRLLGRVDADDILQEAYLDAATRIEHYLNDPATTFFIWLRTVVGQTLIDVHRRHLGAQKRDVRREVKQKRRVFSASTSFQIADVLLGDLTSPSQAALKEELAKQLHEALESMNEIDREILVLRHFEELSNLEASEVLEIEPKTASMRYFRALTRLRSILVQIPGIIE